MFFFLFGVAVLSRLWLNMVGAVIEAKEKEVVEEGNMGMEEKSKKEVKDVEQGGSAHQVPSCTKDNGGGDGGDGGYRDVQGGIEGEKEAGIEGEKEAVVGTSCSNTVSVSPHPCDGVSGGGGREGGGTGEEGGDVEGQNQCVEKKEEQQQEGGKANVAKHRMLKHILRKDQMGEAALVHFDGATSVEHGIAMISTMSQKQLQHMFSKVYGAVSSSNNNNWLRKKLMEALSPDGWKEGWDRYMKEPFSNRGREDRLRKEINAQQMKERFRKTMEEGYHLGRVSHGGTGLGYTIFGTERPPLDNSFNVTEPRLTRKRTRDEEEVSEEGSNQRELIDAVKSMNSMLSELLGQQKQLQGQMFLNAPAMAPPTHASQQMQSDILGLRAIMQQMTGGAQMMGNVGGSPMIGHARGALPHAGGPFGVRHPDMPWGYNDRNPTYYEAPSVNTEDSVKHQSTWHDDERQAKLAELLELMRLLRGEGGPTEAQQSVQKQAKASEQKPPENEEFMMAQTLEKMKGDADKLDGFKLKHRYLSNYLAPPMRDAQIDAVQAVLQNKGKFGDIPGSTYPADQMLVELLSKWLAQHRH